ncbi:MAG: roadblock/LC7 domain-containing protein [Planctomycetes bacterium]|nr:roadblock/LC7 domain-containing protein [Planctomycetota bacterium]
MMQILRRLNDTPGIRGSMVMTDDGMVAAATLGAGLEEESVAALASGLLGQWKRSLAALGRAEGIEEASLGASDGRLVFVEVGGAYLVAVTGRGIDLAATFGILRDAARKLRARNVLAGPLA